MGVGSRGPEPGRAGGPDGGRSYLVVARDGWLTPSGIPGSRASGGRRRPLPRPPLLFPLQSPPRRRRRRPRPSRRAAPIPLFPPHTPGPDRSLAPGVKPDLSSRSAPPQTRRLPPAARNAWAAPPAPAAPLAPAAGPALRAALPAASRPPPVPAPRGPHSRYPRPLRRPPPAVPSPSRAVVSLAPFYPLPEASGPPRNGSWPLAPAR